MVRIISNGTTVSVQSLIDGCISSGGSRKNWTTCVNAGSTLIVRDFPRAIATGLISKCQAGETKHVYTIEEEPR